MLGDLDLRFAEDGLKMTDAERRLRQQMRDAQSRPVAETLMDLNQVHPDLATGCDGGTASVDRHARVLLPFLRETLGAPLAEDHLEMFAGRLYFRNRILRDDTAIVFDFDLESIVRQDLAPELEDFREAVGLQPVVRVLPDVSLEQDGLAPSHHAAAINEVLHDVAHFGDVSMRRDEIAIRQNKARQGIRILFENRAEIRKLHAESIFLLRHIVKGLGSSSGRQRGLVLNQRREARSNQNASVDDSSLLALCRRHYCASIV